MKQMIFILTFFLISACASVQVPTAYTRYDIQTKYFTLTSFQKITSEKSVYKIYIEGDGYAFNAHGLPTSDPTPKGVLMREIAFSDPSANVIYLARPCQYQKSKMCEQKYWTTARFSPEVIESSYEAIKSIAGNNDVILIGFSGGALVASLVAVTKKDLNVKKLITIAGNLDHRSWTNYHHLPSLKDSMNLQNYYSQFIKIPQMHYVGQKDEVVPYELTEKFLQNDRLIYKLKNATHNKNWQDIYPKIWNEK